MGNSLSKQNPNKRKQQQKQENMFHIQIVANCVLLVCLVFHHAQPGLRTVMSQLRCHISKVYLRAVSSPCLRNLAIFCHLAFALHLYHVRTRSEDCISRTSCLRRRMGGWAILTLVYPRVKINVFSVAVSPQ